MAKALFELNPGIDRGAAAERFARDTRVQIRDVLTDETAREIRSILAQATPWGMGWQAGIDGEPQGARREQLQDNTAQPILREIAEVELDEQRRRIARGLPPLERSQSDARQPTPRQPKPQQLNAPRAQPAAVPRRRRRRRRGPGKDRSRRERLGGILNR